MFPGALVSRQNINMMGLHPYAKNSYELTPVQVCRRSSGIENTWAVRMMRRNIVETSLILSNIAQLRPEEAWVAKRGHMMLVPVFLGYGHPLTRPRPFMVLMRGNPGWKRMPINQPAEVPVASGIHVEKKV